MTFTIGANPGTTPSSGDGGGWGGYLVSSGVNGSPGGSVLSTAGTIISISIYIFSGAAGNVLLGLYDNGGTSGQPGALKASTASAALGAGWNTINVSSQVLLLAGTYWLAFEVDSGSPSIGITAASGSFTRYGLQTFGMPSTAPSLASTLATQYGIYATLAGPVFGNSSRQYLRR